ncbi:MAG: iron ABC transporter permease, partial [Clostridiales bacterium]|nr:iron ABC transporter permease [Clostridiales bacterium]
MKAKIIAAICISLVILVLGIAIGSVNIPPGDILRIVAHNIFGVTLPEHIPRTHAVIVWNLRLPRALLAYCAGAALS